MSDGYFIYKRNSNGLPVFIYAKQNIDHEEPFLSITKNKNRAAIFETEQRASEILELFKRVDKTPKYGEFIIRHESVLQLI